MASFVVICIAVLLCIFTGGLVFTISRLLPDSSQRAPRTELQALMLRVQQLEHKVFAGSNYLQTVMQPRIAPIVSLPVATPSPMIIADSPVEIDHETPSHLTCENITDTERVFRTATVKSLSGNYDISIHTIPDIVSKHILGTGNWEPFIESQMALIFDKTWTAPTGAPDESTPIDFIDIGGNIGHFTSMAAHMGLRVLTVEPFGLNTPMILNTICKLNPEFSQRVRLHKVALTDKLGGDMCLWSTNSEVNNGNARLTPYFEGQRDFDQDLGKKCMERIASFTLDHLLYASEDGPHLTSRPRALKIDIEGFETRVFRGAKEFLAKHAPCFVFFEYQKVATMTTGVGEREIFDILQSAGYQIYVHVADGKLSADMSLCHGICDFSATLTQHESECGPDALKAALV